MTNEEFLEEIHKFRARMGSVLPEESYRNIKKSLVLSYLSVKDPSEIVVTFFESTLTEYVTRMRLMGFSLDEEDLVIPKHT